MEILASEGLRKGIMIVVVILMLFYGGALRADGKKDLPTLEVFGKIVCGLAVIETLAFFVSDYYVESAGLLPFSIVAIASVVIDVVFVIIISPKVKELRKQLHIK